MLGPFSDHFPHNMPALRHKEEQYDLEKHAEGRLEDHASISNPIWTSQRRPLFLGPLLEALDYKQLKWAGHGLPDNVELSVC